MSNPTDYSIHRTTGTGEIPTLRTVTGQEEQRRKRLPPRRRKRRGASPDDQDARVELVEPVEGSEEQVGTDQAVEPDGPAGPPDAPALDYLV